MDKKYKEFEEFGADAILVAAADEVAEALCAYNIKKRLLETARERKSSYVQAYGAETSVAREEVLERLNQLRAKLDTQH